jgi:delta8-fatty-acid desaturase
MSASPAIPRLTRELKVYTRQEVEALIAEGRHVFILDGAVIRADAWLKYHPGGPKAIEHMIGRDATDEVRAYVKYKNQLEQC